VADDFQKGAGEVDVHGKADAGGAGIVRAAMVLRYRPWRGSLLPLGREAAPNLLLPLFRGTSVNHDAGLPSHYLTCPPTFKHCWRGVCLSALKVTS
jgi:hypothetical protein